MDNTKLEAMEKEIAELDKQAAEPTVPNASPQEEEKKEEVVTPKEEEKPVERKVYTMPVDKHLKQLENERKRAEEEKAQLVAEYEAKLKSVPKAEVQTPDDIKQFAEQHGIDESVLEGLLTIAEKRVSSKIPNIDMTSFEEIKKEREIEKARLQVSQDFDQKVLPIIREQYPEATLEHIQKVKEKIQELAFTKDFNTYRVEDIYKVNAGEFTFTSKQSAESSRGGTGSMVDYDNVTDEQLKNMSVQEADKYFEYISKKGSSYIN